MVDLLKFTTAKFIKLGEKGCWEADCIKDGTIRLDYREVSDSICKANDKQAIVDLFIKDGVSKGAASSHARQVLDFYQAGDDNIWIMFYGGYLWWAISDGPVHWLDGGEGEIKERGSRYRDTIDGWHNTSIGGTPLYENELNGALTKVKGFRGTVCDVGEFEYLYRKINDQELSQIVIAKETREETLKCIVDLMRMLTWQDFELLVDLVFSESGWRRLNLTGGTQKTTDMELELPTTGEKAFVQVKSSTNQKQFEEYLRALEQRYEDRMFYVYHTVRGKLNNNNDKVTMVDGLKLAEMVLSAGLFDWLIKKAG